MTLESFNPEDSFIERLNKNPEVMKEMLSMSEELNLKLPKMRREEKFSFLWTQTNMSREEVIELVCKRELDFVREYEDMGVPEWMLRCEAQDVLIEFMHEKFKEEELI